MALSAYSGSWLGDLAREQGPERFAAFWHSTLPVDSAFHQAFGVPLGEWTYQWTRRNPEFDPRAVRPWSVTISLFLVALMMGAVCVGASAREISA